MSANILCIPLLILLGVGLQRFRLRRALETLVIYLTYPALMFSEATKLEIGLSTVPLLSLVYLLLCFCWSSFTCRGFGERERKTVVFNSTFLNSIFLPFPLIHAFYGDLTFAILFSLPVMVVHNTLGLLYISSDKRTLRKLVTFPPLISFFLGLLLRPLNLRDIVGPLHDFGRLTVYLCLILVGLYLPISPEVVRFDRVSLRIFLNRTVFSPLLMLPLIFPVQSQLARRTLLLNSLMPPAITNVVIASNFGLDAVSTSRSIFLPTFFSLALVFLLRAVSVL